MANALAIGRIEADALACAINDARLRRKCVCRGFSRRCWISAAIDQFLVEIIKTATKTDLKAIGQINLVLNIKAETLGRLQPVNLSRGIGARILAILRIIDEDQQIGLWIKRAARRTANTSLPETIGDLIILKPIIVNARDQPVTNTSSVKFSRYLCPQREVLCLIVAKAEETRNRFSIHKVGLAAAKIVLIGVPD